jgi:hypothetical protein
MLQPGHSHPGRGLTLNLGATTVVVVVLPWPEIVTRTELNATIRSTAAVWMTASMLACAMCDCSGRKHKQSQHGRSKVSGKKRGLALQDRHCYLLIKLCLQVLSAVTSVAINIPTRPFNIPADVISRQKKAPHKAKLLAESESRELPYVWLGKTTP